MKKRKDPEYGYSNKVTKEHRKQFAQFFTPRHIAEFMVDWLMGCDRLNSILEPAFGLGIFTRTLMKKQNSATITGYEIDNIILNEAKDLFHGNNRLEIRHQDYIYSNWSDKYDGIICNPPYFKFQDYNNLGTTEEMKKHLKQDFSGFTNLYAYFLVKSVSQLTEGGRCAYIIPSEFMNSDYGVQIKEYLIQSKRLRHVIVFHFDEQIFEDALTTSAIILCANDRNTESISFTNISNNSELNRIEDVIMSYPDIPSFCKSYQLKDMKSSIKWKSYYQSLNQSNFTHLVPFSTFAKVSRGIATGANDFFKFNLSKAQQYGIPKKNLKPCICHCVDISGSFFNQTDLERLRDKDKYVFIFDGENSQDQSVLNYIKKGENDKCNEKVLTKSRNPWYALERRSPAPIWVSVFSRDKLNFIRNTSNATCLTTFHCIYPKESLFNSISIELLFAYLITNTARLIFLDNGREYGNGLSKFEPNDLNKGMMLDLRILEENAKQAILQEFSAYKKGESGAADRIDKLLQEQFVRKTSSRLNYDTV